MAPGRRPSVACVKTHCMEKIAIVGCGALGSLFAGLLAKAGAQVTASCRSTEHREALQANGLLLIEDEKQIRVPLRVFSELPSEPLPETAWDLVIVLVKSFDTEAAAASLAAHLQPGTPVLTLQNGLGNAEALAAHLKQNPILAGTATFGALRERPGVVRLTGRGACEIGAWNQAAESHLEPAAQLLSRCGIPCAISPNVMTALWKKLAVNAVVNPLTAILKVPNGALLEREELAPFFREVVVEVGRVAAKCGIPLPPPDELLQEVHRVCRTTAANHSSMLRDVEQGRRTEIDAINGAVVRLGRQRGVPTPANLLLAALIRAMAPSRKES